MKKYTSDEAINAQILKALASSIRVVVIAGSNKTTVFSPRSNCLLNVKLPNDRAILARELGVEESNSSKYFVGLVALIIYYQIILVELCKEHYLPTPFTIMSNMHLSFIKELIF